MIKRSATLAAVVGRSAIGVRAVVRRRIDLFHERIGEWRSVAKLMAIAGPRESVAQLDRLALAVFRAKLRDLEELVRVMEETQRAA